MRVRVGIRVWVGVRVRVRVWVGIRVRVTVRIRGGLGLGCWFRFLSVPGRPVPV